MKHSIYYGSALCLYVVHAYGAAQHQELTKVFFHEGQLRDRIVLQFSAQPTIQELPVSLEHAAPQKNNRTMQTVSLFIPQVALLSAEARGMLTAVNRIKKEHYTINLRPVNRPAIGLEVTIMYNPRIAAFSYGTFDSITTQKCVTFNFDDKHKLDMLEKKSKPLHTLASFNKPKVVLDYGHGGADTGKVAHNGIQEKDIAAQIGAKVKLLLQQKGYDVLLTRIDDSFVRLDERTRFANGKKADLFISLHANAAFKQDAAGLETYWAGQQLEKCYRVGDSRWLDCACKRDQASKLLATTVHTTILQQISPVYALLDRKVRASGAQVLFATDMPSILIELGFLSNPHEAQMLARASFQNLLAQGISKGIDTFYTRYVQA